MKKYIALRFVLLAGSLVVAVSGQGSDREMLHSAVKKAVQQNTALGKSPHKSDDSKRTHSKSHAKHTPERGHSESTRTVTGITEKRIKAKDVPLSLRINLKSRVIDIDQSFRVVLTNHSDHPIRIWNPQSRNGYYQLSIQFTNPKTGEVHIARKRVIENEYYWRSIADRIGSESRKLEIDPGGDYAVWVCFSGSDWGKHVWTGLPDPDTDVLWKIRAQFESSIPATKDDQPVWNGKIQSQASPAKLVAARLKTPHDYLEEGFPGKALEIMKADLEWVWCTNQNYRDHNHRTPLHVAARFGQVEAVKWLLKKGADVNAIAYNGFTPLHLAEDREVIRLILEKKPKLNQLDSQRRTPLQVAATKLVDAHEERPKLYNDEQRRKWKAIVDLYLEAGAEYDLLVAIHLDDLERVKAILKESPLWADDFQDSSPLRLAASLGRLEICQCLIEKHRVDVNDFERGFGYPIIKETLDHPKVARLLIENGADLKTRITWRGGRTGIWIIGNDATLLHFAARDGVPETINLLINNGVDIFATAHDVFDKSDKQTALEVAAIFGKADNAAAILRHRKFDLEGMGRHAKLLDKCLLYGAFSRSWAREANRPDLIEVLLKKGANPNAEENGVTAVQLAALCIHPNHEEENREIRELISNLVNHGADLDLFSAVAIGDEQRVARLLKQNPASANARGANGYPALHFAVRMNYKNIVKRLLDAGGYVDIRNKCDGIGDLDETALDCAAFWGRYEIGKLLIGAGADVNARTERKSTPLHSAARLANVKFARLLLENGANIDARDSDGETPLSLSRQSNRNDQLEKLLQEYLQEK